MTTLYHEEVIGESIIPATPGKISTDLNDALWRLLEEVGNRWEFSSPSSGTRSSWTEFVALRCEKPPSYLGEYQNALQVVSSLAAMPELADPVGLLFNHQSPKKLNDHSTRLDHAKKYVIDEFITVRIVAGGFREFGGKKRAYNYNGFVRGTRYNRVMRIRAYQPDKFRPRRFGRKWRDKEDA